MVSCDFDDACLGWAFAYVFGFVFWCLLVLFGYLFYCVTLVWCFVLLVVLLLLVMRLLVGGLCDFANWWILVGVVWCLFCVLLVGYCLWVVCFTCRFGLCWFVVLCVAVFCFCFVEFDFVWIICG